jgi:hypothetical protein
MMSRATEAPGADAARSAESAGSTAPVAMRIFVVGAPRSGTTLVQSLLAAHERLVSFPESHLFSRHFRALPVGPAAVLVRDPVPRLESFLGEVGLAPGEPADSWIRGVRRRVPVAPLRPLGTRRVARELLAVLDRVAERRERSCWVEKTPMHLRLVPFLERISAAEVPTRFVHVLRDGLAVVASLRAASRSWERPYDLDTCIRRWNDDLERSERRLGASGDRFVVYEELVRDPLPVLGRLFGGLGLEAPPDVLERYSEGVSDLVTVDETWKGNVAGGLRRSSESAADLSPEERERARVGLRLDRYRELCRRLG